MSDENKPVDIKEKRMEKAEKVKKSKPKLADYYSAIVQAMNKDKYAPMPDFPDVYYALKVDDETKIPVRDLGDNVVLPIPISSVIDSVLKYCHKTMVPSGKDGYSLEHKHAKECAKVWLSLTETIETPKMVRWQGENGFTYRRLPWPLQTGETPVFDEMMSRTSNADALQAFIGSLFVEKSNKQQYCWIFGEGQNGKSALTSFLKRALGSAYKALMVPSDSAKRFWTLNLIGCRVGVFADTNNTEFITGGLFKSLTGGDPVPCEIKNGAQFTTEMNTKFIFLSNSRPSIASETADLRRLLLFEMGPINGAPDPEYPEKLWAEGGAFLSKCLHKYALMCPTNGVIPITNIEDVKDLASANEEEFESFFEANLELAPNEGANPMQLCGRLRAHFKNTRKEKDFRAWLERVHGVRRKTIREGNTTFKMYKGVRIIYTGCEGV